MGKLNEFNQFANQHCNVNELDQLGKTHLMKRREKELKRKIEQINNEIEIELNDFYDQLYLKQISIVTLSNLKDFLEEQLMDVQNKVAIESIIDRKGEAS